MSIETYVENKRYNILEKTKVIINQICLIFKKSYCFKILDKVHIFFKKKAKESFFLSLFSQKTNYENAFSESIVLSYILKIKGKLVSNINFVSLNKTLFSSLIFRILFNISKNCIYLSVALLFLAPFLPTIAIYLISATNLTLFFVRSIASIPKEKLDSANYIEIMIISFLCLGLFSTIVSNQPFSSAKTFIQYSLLASQYFVLSNFLNEKKRLNITIKAFVFSGLLVSTLSIFNYHNTSKTEETWIDEKMFQQIKKRNTGPLGNPNVLGEFLMFSIPMSIALAIKEKNNFRIVSIFSALIGIISLILTFSRGCWLASACAFLAIILFFFSKYIFAFIFTFFATISYAPSLYIDRVKSIINIKESSNIYRLRVWFACFRMFCDSWNTGIGLGSEVFKNAFKKYSRGSLFPLHSHNLYLQLPIEFGIFGLILFLLILFSILRIIVQNILNEKNTKNRPIDIAFFAIISSFLVEAFFENYFYEKRILLIIFMFLAIIIQSNKISLEDK